jgi:hypothetical protein
MTRLRPPGCSASSWTGVACLAVALAACASHRTRASTSTVEVSATSCWLAQDARPGMFITWLTEKADPEPDDVREDTIACVSDAGGLVTMERRETVFDGSTRVTATRFRRDGTLVDAWQGPLGGVAAAARVNSDAVDPQELAARTERLRKQGGLPAPDVSSTQATEWVETPAGRIRCVKQETRVSMLFVTGRFTTWHAVTPLPLSSLVKTEGHLANCINETTLLKAYGTSGAQPTLSIPVSAR